MNSNEKSESAVQPRACGEHARSASGRNCICGSAPRVRGTLLIYNQAVLGERFSPARAGNTAVSGRRSSYLAVQPRACGEHCPMARMRNLLPGSAPRVRGTPAMLPKFDCSMRFSPARAGNTRPAPDLARGTAVQPRACGEHTNNNGVSGILDGSAPRVRGTRDSYTRDQALDRFSPARAGNTFESIAPTLAIPVQPRACGEHNVAMN